MEEIIKEISKIEFDLFVVNPHAIAIQQNDGRYITKYIQYDSSLIENMLLNNGSAGCYHQSYGNGKIKWICLDFDCKDKSADEEDISDLYTIIKTDLLSYLDELQITYLTEFSGRRGIHVWIIFGSPVDKEIGYWIINTLRNKVDLNDKYGIDLFPQTDSYIGNRVGKQVKFPLSTHKSGGKSFFFKDSFELPDDYDLDFYRNQLFILKGYSRNDIIKVLEKLGYTNNTLNFNKYKNLIVNDECNIKCNQVINILSEIKVYKEIFTRLDHNYLEKKDWYVLLGTLSPLNDSELLKSIFRRTIQYDESITSERIESLKNQYRPATFEYLYSIYDMDIEENIDKTKTGLEYLAEKLNLSLEENNIIKNELDLLGDLEATVRKETNYMLDNDENLEITEWIRINGLTKYDIQILNDKIKRIIDSDDVIPLNNYYVYVRKESNTKKRNMVVLNTEERIITTQLALMIAYRHGSLLKSYSYNVSFLSDTNLFYNWYTSWGNYIDKIKSYIEIPFLGDWGVMTIDLKNYFDNIDFLSLYRGLSDGFSLQDKCIMKKLIDYNERLMRKVNDDNVRIGIPQGPAYARIIAELFLNRILERIPETADTLKKNYVLYRYVDDIIIFYKENVDADILMQNIKKLLSNYNLKTNEEKTYIYGRIEDLSDKDINLILRKDRFNYNFQYSETDYLRDKYEKQRIFIECLKDSFNIDDVSYLFGYKTDTYYTEKYFYKYAKNIFESEYGRGSTFKKFYNYLFTNKELLNYALENELFLLIKPNSINFKNCISCLYLNIYNDQLEKSIVIEIYDHYLKKLNLEEIDNSEYNIIQSIKRWSK